MTSTTSPPPGRPSTVDDTTLRQFATAGAQGQRLAALIVGTRKETR